ncbi:OST-HTH/LOTUS domain-containing protein [uncultured Arthrobacter sp.]|uniref:OST-HTH/LOTUS domain-containing protein n=1 Tax=uncultured Arthrobacter sp. TaxID=114050 RepID=UPI00261F6ADD|nr:OST-HTH/LOTUS domain-containing protein [uncultured Arthrobacter sp.]
MGSQIGNQASSDSRNYGYRKLSDLIEGIGLFDVKRGEPTGDGARQAHCDSQHHHMTLLLGSVS